MSHSSSGAQDSWVGRGARAVGELGPELENLLLGLVQLVIQHFHLW